MLSQLITAKLFHLSMDALFNGAIILRVPATKLSTRMVCGFWRTTILSHEDGLNKFCKMKIYILPDIDMTFFQYFSVKKRGIKL